MANESWNVTPLACTIAKAQCILEALAGREWLREMNGGRLSASPLLSACRCCAMHRGRDEHAAHAVASVRRATARWGSSVSCIQLRCTRGSQTDHVCHQESLRSTSSHTHMSDITMFKLRRRL